MLWLLLGRRFFLSSHYNEDFFGQINLVPGRTIALFVRVLQKSRAWYSDALVRAAYVNLLGNVLLFIPLGYLLPALFPPLRRFRHTVMCAIWIIIAVETTQLLTHLGSCDIDDLILNIAGVVPGYRLWYLLAR